MWIQADKDDEALVRAEAMQASRSAEVASPHRLDV